MIEIPPLVVSLALGLAAVTVWQRWFTDRRVILFSKALVVSWLAILYALPYSDALFPQAVDVTVIALALILARYNWEDRQSYRAAQHALAELRGGPHDDSA